MANASTRLRDLLAAARLRLAKIAASESAWALQRLRPAIDAVVRAIRRSGPSNGPLEGAALAATLTALAAAMDELDVAYRRVGEEQQGRLERIAMVEAERVQQQLDRAMGPTAEAQEEAPEREEIVAAILALLVAGGATGGATWRGLASSQARRIEQRLVAGLSGEPAEAVLRQLARAAAAAIEQESAALARQIVQAIAPIAEREIFRAELGPLIRAWQWSSVLDARTTVEWCLPRAGLLYGVDYQPIGHDLPWLEGPGLIHWNCRSSAVPVFHDWRALGLTGLSAGEKALLNGKAPLAQDGEAWLRTLSQADLVEFFGPTRAQAWAVGELSVEDMVRPDGSLLTLEELGV